MRGSYHFELQIVPLAVVIPLFVSSETVSRVAQAHFHAKETHEVRMCHFHFSVCLYGGSELLWQLLSVSHKGPTYSVDQAMY